MSTLTRYLVLHYLKNLCVLLALSLALVICSKLEAVAKLIAAGTPPYLVGRFFISFFPLFFSLTLPIASICSAFLLTFSISQSGELTATRCGGLTLWHIILPPLFISIFISTSIIYITSEWETRTHLVRRSLYKEMLMLNPLKIIQNIKGIPFFIPPKNSISKDGKEECLCVLSKEDRILIYISPVIDQSNSNPQGAYSTSITTIKEGEKAPSLIIENAKETVFDTSGLRSQVESRHAVLKQDYLNLGMLRLLREKVKNRELPIKETHIQKWSEGIFSECMRRISLGFLSTTLTLLGLTMGISVSRLFPTYRFISLLALTFSCLICYFSAQGIQSISKIAIPLYFLPHLVIWTVCLYDLHKISSGKTC